MKIGTLQYQYGFPTDSTSYQRNISRLVAQCAEQGVELLLFPEYAGFEAASFIPLERWDEWVPDYVAFFQSLSKQHQMHICSGTQVVRAEMGVFNRSYLFSPKGEVGYQDKCILTPYEVEEGLLSPGNKMSVFETDLGKIGICICYDIEFPSIVKKLVDQGVELILVPSYTATVHGFYRVLTSSRARALENQCYVVQSVLVGKTDVEVAHGASAICTPIDEGFPQDGLFALGTMDRQEMLIADLDLELLKKVRSFGQTRNYQDGQLLDQRKIPLESFHLK